MMKRLIATACLGVLLTLVAATSIEAAHVNLLELDNKIISPVTQQHIEEGIARSESDGAVCLVILLDTPGGLLESTRGIVKRIMNAKVPVVVYVAPSGSRAGSAGVFITLAAHVAAMAPSTNIGAAHPVGAGGAGGPAKKLIRRIKRVMDEAPERKTSKDVEEEIVEEQESDPMADKILNDTVAWVTTIAKARGRNEEWAKKSVTESFSITEADALKERIVDLIATDVDDLLAKLQGRRVELGGVAVELQTAGTELVRLPMSARQEFLATITNPNIAYLLMMLGTLGLIFEFTHPGVGFPGIAGLICMLLALYAFQALPISYAGVALVLVGLGLLVAELFVASFGLLGIGGVIALTLGSLLLVESPDPSLQIAPRVILPSVATLAGIILVVVQRAVRSQTRRVATGSQGLLGEIGSASTDLKPDGTVFVHGETWTATSPRPVKRGQRIRVVRVDGLRLVVEPEQKGGR
jgi:membrane-bound serine protease (ClpP class)